MLCLKHTPSFKERENFSFTIEKFPCIFKTKRRLINVFVFLVHKTTIVCIRFSFSHLPFKSISLTLILLLLIPLSDRFNLIDFVVVIVIVSFFLLLFFIYPILSLPSFSSSSPCFCSWLCNCLYLTLLWVFIKRQFSHFVWIFFTFRWKIQFFLIFFSLLIVISLLLLFLFLLLLLFLTT